jgi:hypothetical protein
MNSVRGTYGGKEKGIKGFGAETRKNEHLEDLGVDGRIL